MHAELRHWVSECERCAVAKGPYLTARTPMGSIIANKPLEVLAMDFTQLGPASDGHENVLVLTDVFTMFTVAYQPGTRRMLLWLRPSFENGLWCMEYPRGFTQTRADLLWLKSSRNSAQFTASRSRRPHPTTLRETASVRGTVLCMNCCEPYLLRREDDLNI